MNRRLLDAHDKKVGNDQREELRRRVRERFDVIFLVGLQQNFVFNSDQVVDQRRGTDDYHQRKRIPPIVLAPRDERIKNG